MTHQSVPAVYRKGAFHPLVDPMLPENTNVRLIVSSPTGDEEGSDAKPWMKAFGTLPDQDAAEMLAAIKDEFERIDPRDWEDRGI